MKVSSATATECSLNVFTPEVIIREYFFMPSIDELAAMSYDVTSQCFQKHDVDS